MYFRGARMMGSFAAAECSRADSFLQLAKLTSGQAKSSTRALKKARASLTLQLRKLTSGQARNDRTFEVTSCNATFAPGLSSAQS
jgi:hypothetical protein